MAPVTRSQTRTAIRRRNISVRKFTFIIRDNVPESEEEEEIETVHDEDSDYAESEVSVETETENTAVAEEPNDDTSSVDDLDGDGIQDHINNLRTQLREAEELLKAWKKEQDDSDRENNRGCARIILVLLVSVLTYMFIEWHVEQRRLGKF